MRWNKLSLYKYLLFSILLPMKTPQNIIKYLVWLLIVVVIRLLPHFPNVEPIMATMMPFSKKWGWVSGMIFCLIAILSFDLITGTLGVWSILTAGTYTLLGISAGIYFKNKENKIKYYLIFAIIGTIVYDAITGIGTWMIFFNQPFMTTFIGQIPFTLYHLAWNIVFSIIISPLLYRWVIINPKFETKYILNKIAFR